MTSSKKLKIMCSCKRKMSDIRKSRNLWIFCKAVAEIFHHIENQPPLPRPLQKISSPKFPNNVTSSSPDLNITSIKGTTKNPLPRKTYNPYKSTDTLHLISSQLTFPLVGAAPTMSHPDNQDNEILNLLSAVTHPLNPIPMIKR